MRRSKDLLTGDLKVKVESQGRSCRLDLQKGGPTFMIIRREDLNGSDPHEEDLDDRDSRREDPHG